MSPNDPSAGRRKFLKLLAASPLLALAGVPEEWKEAILGSSGGSGLVRSAAAQVAGGQQADSLISSVEEAINVYDFREVARESLLPQHWAYLKTGVNDDPLDPRMPERELNDVAFDWLQYRSRFIPEVGEVDMSVELFGRRWETPITLCPVGSLKGFHTQGELGTARAARSRNVLQMLSTVSSTAVEEVNEARGEPVWYQLYAPRAWEASQALLERVEDAGCPTVVWTIDLMGGSNRETVDRSTGPEGTDQEFCQQCHEHQPDYQKPMRRGLPGPLFGGDGDAFTWDYVSRLKNTTDMNVVVKGVMTAEGTQRALDHGADGIMVSNHGGRASHSGRAAIEALPEIAETVDGRVPVIFDSGIRRGADIFKALALGADAVGIGRAYVWGLAAFGQEGVETAIDILTDELAMVMRQTGTRSIDEIGPDKLMDPTGRIMGSARG